MLKSHCSGNEMALRADLLEHVAHRILTRSLTKSLSINYCWVSKLNLPIAVMLKRLLLKWKSMI
jgi:hypothetical protein